MTDLRFKKQKIPLFCNDQKFYILFYIYPSNFYLDIIHFITSKHDKYETYRFYKLMTAYDQINTCTLSFNHKKPDRTTPENNNNKKRTSTEIIDH